MARKQCENCELRHSLKTVDDFIVKGKPVRHYCVAYDVEDGGIPQEIVDDKAVCEFKMKE